MQKGDILKLKGVTQKGCNRVREHGDLWVVAQDPRPTICFGGDLGVLVTPALGSPKNKSLGARHLRVTSEKHFDIRKAE